MTNSDTKNTLSPINKKILKKYKKEFGDDYIDIRQQYNTLEYILYIFLPSDERNYYTIATIGFSDNKIRKEYENQDTRFEILFYLNQEMAALLISDKVREKKKELGIKIYISDICEMITDFMLNVIRCNYSLKYYDLIDTQYKLWRESELQHYFILPSPIEKDHNILNNIKKSDDNIKMLYLKLVTNEERYFITDERFRFLDVLSEQENEFGFTPKELLRKSYLEPYKDKSGAIYMNLIKKYGDE